MAVSLKSTMNIFEVLPIIVGSRQEYLRFSTNEKNPMCTELSSDPTTPWEEERKVAELSHISHAQGRQVVLIGLRLGFIVNYRVVDC